MSISTLPSPVRKLAIGVSLSMLLGAAHAAPIFTDDFESGLSKWNPVGSAAAVSDPLNPSNTALNFGAGGSGGDIFSAAPFLQSGTYFLSFDILGTCATGNCGGFIGINQFNQSGGFIGEVWIAGDNTYTPISHLVQNNGSWQHFEFGFTAAGSTFRLKIEDFVRSLPAGDVYFDNICVSATAGDASCPRTVPEPGSLALVGMSLLGLAGLRRRKAA